jgi:hypothetical protein
VHRVAPVTRRYRFKVHGTISHVPRTYVTAATSSLLGVWWFCRYVYSYVCTVLFFSSSLCSHRYRHASCHCERGFCRSPQAVHRDCSRLTRFPRSPHLQFRRAHFLRRVSAFPTSVLFCVRSHDVLTDADVALSVLRARQPWQAFGAYKTVRTLHTLGTRSFFFPMK